jgi:hypothetical protein
MTDILKQAYSEGWSDRDSSEENIEARHVAIEKDWVKSNSYIVTESIDRKWEWRYNVQMDKIRELERTVAVLGKELRKLKN